MHSSRILSCVVVSGILVAAAHAQLVHGAERMCGAELVSADVLHPNPPQNRFENASVSADGRWIAFHSANPALVPGDTNGRCDVFVLDRASGAVERASVASDGSQIPGGNPFYLAMYPALSADGRYVAFSSNAPNLVANDGNGTADVFVRDRWSGTTTRASVDSLGAEHAGASGLEGAIIFPNPTMTWFNQGLAISADGRFVAFSSWASLDRDDTGNKDAFVRDQWLGTTVRVSKAADGSQSMGVLAALSGDGRCAAFSSNAANLVAGVTGQVFRIYVHDLASGTTTCESRSTAGVPASANCYAPAALSADGRFLAFRSDASNLVSGDTNGEADVFVRDVAQQATQRVSLAWNGAQANDASMGPQISADGRLVAFLSFATNMLPGGSPFSQPYVHDRAIGRTLPVVGALHCGPPSSASLYPALSADGGTVVFESLASNLAPGDVNGAWDLYAARMRYVIHAQHH